MYEVIYLISHRKEIILGANIGDNIAYRRVRVDSPYAKNYNTAL